MILFVHNFAKCWWNLKTISPLDSISRHTLTVVTLPCEMYEKSKMVKFGYIQATSIYL